MNPVEQPLYQALEAAPEDWSIRLLLIEKLVEREAYDEAAAIIEGAPNAPGAEEVLQRIVEIGGVHAIEPAKQFVQDHPESAFAHHVLGELFAAAGDEDRSRKHLSVASALGADVGTADSETTAELEPEPEPADERVRESTPPEPVSTTGHHRGPATQAIARAHSAPAATSEKPKKKRGAKASAAIIAVIVHAVILFIAALLVILPPAVDNPEIIASVIGPPVKKNEMQKKNVVKQTKQSTSASAAAAPIAQMMRASAMAKFAMPEVTRTSTGPLGIGDGDLGAGGFGGGSGLGTGASFFGGTSTGNRFAFILDYSQSMKPAQINLVVSEMGRTLKALKPGAKFQVILFAGGGRFAIPGWSAENVKTKKHDVIVKDPSNKEYYFKMNKITDYRFEGSDSQLPTTEWLDVSPANAKKVMGELNARKLWAGTDWRDPFKMALNLNPAPDVIFFMADGTGGAHPPTILSYAKKKNPRVQVNMFAMQTTAGAAEMNEIAERTSGDYRIILSNGKTIEGEEFFKDKKKVEALIKSGRK